MRRFFLFTGLSLFLISCGLEKKPEKTQEEAAAEALPENIGDKTAPTAIKAYKGAKEVKKQTDVRTQENSKVLKESD